MKITKDFNDFLIDMLLESENKKGHGVTELPFMMSPALKSVLSSISHPIAKKLLKADEEREDKKVTFVDLDEDNNKKFTLVNSNKAFDNIKDEYGGKVKELTKLSVSLELDNLNITNFVMTNNYWKKNRATVKIGSFIGKVFPDEYKQSGNPGNDIESFVQAIIAKRIELKDRREGKGRFKLVKGEDIVKYYDESVYDVEDEDENDIDGSPLANSCMRYERCGDYVNFYAQNKDVSMLILFSDVEGREDKIVGRAIVWKLGMPSGRTFMDRIYYRYDSDMAMFKQYAEKQGWLYKSKQDMFEDTKIVDPKDDTINRINMSTTDTVKKTPYYPYMDTLKWFNIEKGYLTNDSDIEQSGYEFYKLEHTEGGYESDDRIYVEFYDESFDEDDLTYCQLGDDYRKHDDAHYVESSDQYATQEYVDDNMVWSDNENTLLYRDDAIYSDYNSDYIRVNDSIELSSGADEPNMDEVREIDDIRHEDEIGSSVINYIDEYGITHYFDMDEYGEYFITVKTGPEPGEENKMWKHKIWDKDKLFKYKGIWYYEYDVDMKDKIIGQTRIWD